jgi:hypothetical protein
VRLFSAVAHTHTHTPYLPQGDVVDLRDAPDEMLVLAWDGQAIGAPDSMARHCLTHTHTHTELCCRVARMHPSLQAI